MMEDTHHDSFPAHEVVTIKRFSIILLVLYAICFIGAVVPIALQLQNGLPLLLPFISIMATVGPMMVHFLIVRRLLRRIKVDDNY